MDDRAIGVFDSGLGGLTVVAEIMRQMPNESITYFGDTGRTPYGTKSKETVTKYTFQNIRFLLSQNVKMIVIACNTASACSLDSVVKVFSHIPIVGVINPSIVAAVKHTRNKNIGVIGTPATINSKAYEVGIVKADGESKVHSIACPFFVPLVEEGWWEHEVAFIIAKEYLSSLNVLNIDTLVLGCTHYPLLQKAIAQAIDHKIKIISSAEEAATETSKLINNYKINVSEGATSVYKYFTSDSVEKFGDMGKMILNKELINVEKVDIEKYL